MRSIILALVIATAATGRLPAQLPDSIWIVEPRWSPDGKSIVFAAGPSGRLKVFAVDLDGTSLKRLACSDSSDSPADWSPDGRSIVFGTRRHGSSAVYVRDIPGRQLRRLSPPGMTATIGKWSPDGSRIAFTVSDSSRNRNIWTANQNGSDLKPLTTGTNRYELLGWSSRGLLVTTARTNPVSTTILILPPDGSPPNAIISSLAGTVYGGSWSPDARRIAFDLHEGNNSDIYIVDADGANLRKVIDHPARDYGPSWSPDGQHLMFFSTRERRQYYFYEYSIADGSTRRMTATDAWRQDAPCAEAGRIP